MKYPLALSTCWNSHRHTDGYAMLKEIADMGFSATELSHGIRGSLVPGIRMAIYEGWIKATSVHNFCPLPPSVSNAAPNYYLPTSPYKGERYLWVRQTIQTLHFCHEIGADRLVLHLGRVFFFFKSPWLRYEAYESQLKKKEGEKYAQKLEQAREKAAKKLAKAQTRVWSRLRECLEQVVPLAEELGVKLAGENREDPHEVPVDYEGTRMWTEKLAQMGIGYWHDSGHARVKERDGLIQIVPWLNQVKPHILGWHLHDVNEKGKDHQKPGSGTVSFTDLLPFYEPAHALTLELSPSLPADQVLEGAEYLRKVGYPV
jgi:sugar phosphate isomerase/epimerase